MNKSIFVCIICISIFFLGCEQKIIEDKTLKPTKQEMKIEQINKDVKNTIHKPKHISVKDKKERFIKLLLPDIRKVYSRLDIQYKEIDNAIKNGLEDSRIQSLKKTYKVSTNEDLLIALKPHPISLTLSQAAMESSWATSRFFKEANNIFGIWSVNKNEPRIAASEKRDERTIWIKKYSSIEESIQDYYKLLSRGKAFKSFRQERFLSNNPHKLAKNLDNYSEKGSEYGEELIAIIEYNKFKKFDY